MDVVVWRKAVSLASSVYALTELLANGPHQQLTSQMRTSALSIASSIAEGTHRATRSEYIDCLYVARRSVAELETQICIGLELRLIEPGSCLRTDAAEMSSLLDALVLRVREHREKAAAFAPVRSADNRVVSAPTRSPAI